MEPCCNNRNGTNVVIWLKNLLILIENSKKKKKKKPIAASRNIWKLKTNRNKASEHHTMNHLVSALEDSGCRQALLLDSIETLLELCSVASINGSAIPPHAALCLLLPPKCRPTLCRSPTRKTQLNGSTFSPKHRHHRSFSPPTQQLHLLWHHPSPALHLLALPISHSQQFLSLSHPQFFSPTTLSTPGFLLLGLMLGSTPIEFLFLFLVANLSLG